MSNKIRPLLSLVIPACNEQNRLPATFQQIREHIVKWAFSFELIVVVEPSEDRTPGAGARGSAVVAKSRGAY